jgi:hypothetical protein
MYRADIACNVALLAQPAFLTRRKPADPAKPRCHPEGWTISKCHLMCFWRARVCCQISRPVLLALATWLVLVDEGTGVAQEVGINNLIRFHSEVLSMENSSAFQQLKETAVALSNNAAKRDDMEIARTMAQMASEQDAQAGKPLSANVIGAVISAKLAPERILQAAPLVPLEARTRLAEALENNSEIKQRVANIDQIFVSASPSAQQQHSRRLEAVSQAGSQAVTTITDLYKQGARKCELNEGDNKRQIDRLSKDLLEIYSTWLNCPVP